MNKSKKFMIGWISGFWDGEGSVTLRRVTNKRKHTSYYLTVSNTDTNLMQVCQEYLTNLGIEWTMWKYRTRGKYKPIGTLHIGKATSIVKFSSFIRLSSPSKQAILDEIVRWIKRKRTKYNLEQLNKWHNGDKISLRDIVKRLGLKDGAHYRFANLLRKYGYTVRQEKTGRKLST